MPIRRGARVVGIGAALAGPLLIAAAVLVLLREFAWNGRITNQHEDLLAAWLPNYCLLGRSLADLAVPNWNPYVMAGFPFAADPQSGWGYLPAMTLFALLPCDVAIRWYIVLLPILAGLGTYLFLTAERVSRVAAIVGGLAIALVMAGSYVGISLAFAATLAWTPLLLAAAARFLRSSAWPARLLWAGITALAWGQLAAAYASNGLFLGTLALGLYLVARLVRDLLARDRRWVECLVMLVLLSIALPLVNLAYFLPRLASISQTTLGLGYRQLQELGAMLGGRPAAALRGNGAAASWVFGLTASPGSYLGAAVLVLSLAGWRSRRWLHLFVPFALLGLVCYLASLESVAMWVTEHGASWPGVDFYLHAPVRFRYGVLIALPVLAAVGLQAWLEARGTLDRVLMVAPGLVVWGVLPFVQGVGGAPSSVFLAGIGVAVVVLTAAAFVEPLRALVPVVVAVELMVNGFAGQSIPYNRNGPSPPVADSGAFVPLQRPSLDAASYLRPSLIGSVLATRTEGRYLTIAGQFSLPTVGFLLRQRPEYWPLMANQRSILFGVEDAAGYNPVQLLRYWQFVRTASPKAKYNVATFRSPSPSQLDLLQVAYIIGRSSAPPASVPGAVPVFQEGEFQLYRVPGASSRATVHTTWTVVDSSMRSLEMITAEGFDPSRELILERDPGLPPRPSPSVATRAGYEPLGHEVVRVKVVAPAPAVVLVRNSYDLNWRATVDGRSAPVLVANHFLQGIPVPEGRHTIMLRYVDPSIRRGVMGSAYSVVGLVLAALVLWVLRSARRRREISGQKSETVGGLRSVPRMGDGSRQEIDPLTSS